MADSSIEIDGIDDTLLFLAQLPADLARAAQEGAQEAATEEAARARTRAASVSSQAALAARSVRAQGGRIIAADGSSVSAAIFYGAEFGGGGRPRTRQFPTHRGTRGYWFFPTLNDDADRIAEVFADALDPIMNEWER